MSALESLRRAQSDCRNEGNTRRLNAEVNASLRRAWDRLHSGEKGFLRVLKFLRVFPEALLTLFAGKGLRHGLAIHFAPGCQSAYHIELL